MKALVMLSGGLDSAAALKYVLQETTYDAHVHHVHYKNDRMRYPAEARAVDRICDFLSKVRPFERSETTQDYRKLGTFMDLPMLAFTAAMVCRVHPDIECVVTGFQLDDPMLRGWTQVNNGLAVRVEQFYEVFNAVLGSTRIFWWPLANMRKPEIKQYAGAELYDMSWSCRMPVWWKSEPSPCGRCIACEERAKCS